MVKPARLPNRAAAADGPDRVTRPHASLNRAADVLRPPGGLYERAVRVVAYLFIAAALLVVTVANWSNQPLIYGLAAVGLVVVVVAQDMLPVTARGGRWLALEALVMIGFVSLLVGLTGGYSSPFFLGYVLVVGGASLWGDTLAPLLLAGASSLAYLLAVAATALITNSPLSAQAAAQVAFIVIAIGLVSYLAAVIGREQRRANEAALALSRFDNLTGLYSRSFFERTLEQEALRAARTGHGFALLLLDLDTLKGVNDSHGHDAGDRLLAGIGEAIRDGVRATDIAGRLGGDEFVVILPETDLAGALRVADKLRTDIGQLSLPTAGTRVGSTVSVGVVTFPEDARSAAELLRRADQAMYQAKRGGKDRIVHLQQAAGAAAGGPAVTVSGSAPWEDRR